MACYHPLSAWQCQDGSVVFSELRYHNSIVRSLTLPCGQCVGCRLERSRQWAVRCMHEASLYRNNCFITLTYSDDFVPEDMSLDVSDFQKFMKRLRKRCSGYERVGNDFPIRFYHCGEYGERYGRPHYHACIFNFDFSDKYYWRKSPSGHRLYRSPLLESLWEFGQSEIGEVTFESAAYVARYIMKKVNGKDADKHYEYVNPDTGEVTWRKPEYTTMSRRPGIAAGWFDKFRSDVYPLDAVIVNGRKTRPPKFYDSMNDKYCVENSVPYWDDSHMDSIKYDRHIKSLKYVDNRTRARLDVREQIQLKQLEKLVRQLD